MRCFIVALALLLLVPACELEELDVASTEAALTVTPLCAEPCTGPSCTAEIRKFDKDLRFYTNFPLTRTNPCITHAVIVVHGSGRNAADYFGYVTTPAADEGVDHSTLIVAPHFVAGDDPRDASDFYWSEQGWKQGDLSKNGSPRLSSFSALDLLVIFATNRVKFPNLEQLVITGHSAGGQFVQRYAIGTNQVDLIDPAIFVRFVPSNPSSYLYLDDKRPTTSGGTVFAKPSGCSSYNKYKYGMSSRNTYMGSRSVSSLVNSARAREIALLLGEDDVLRDDALDTRCQAEVQGRNRLERGVGFLNFMNQYYRPHATYIMTAPGVGHSGRGMFDSWGGRYLLFR